MDATANLLTNAERLSPYREIPNVFSEAVQQMALDSIRTNETSSSNGHASNGNADNGNSTVNNLNSPEINATNYRNNPFMGIPPQQRLFGDDPGANSAQSGSHSSHVMFNQPVPVDHGNSGEATRTGGVRRQGRQAHGASSAPASVDGGKF